MKDHFYTTDANEIGTTTYGQVNKGFKSEGYQCRIFPRREASTQPLYRYYNGRNHFYTLHSAEIGTTTAGVVGNYGYKSEGIAGYCYPQEEAGTIPLYRYHGNGDHFYTTDPAEIGTVVPGAVGHHGYKAEGITCHVIPA